VSLRNIDTGQSYGVFSYFPSFVKTVKYLQAWCPDAVLVAGGAGFSLFAAEIMKQVPELDFGIYLEGEESFPELLHSLDHPETVKGVYYRRNGEVLFTGAREPLAFGSLPMPRRDILDLSVYNDSQSMGVQTKRGCVFDCMYCTYPFLSGRRLRLRSPEKVGQEVEILRREYGKTEIFFADNIFNWPLSHAEAICQELLRRKLDVRWTAYFSERVMAADFAKLAVEAGCVSFEFSPDGCNDASLRRLGKGTTREQLEATYRLIEGAPGARFLCNFMWNYPQTGWRDLRDLCSLVYRLLRMKNLARLGVSTMRILPNTRLRAIAIEEGRIGPEDDLLSPTFYDPFPWNSVSRLINVFGKMLRAMGIMTRKR
jgi:anaerobic magnesium-protoporphyrin IX monomethyl ester cyclase